MYATRKQFAVELLHGEQQMIYGCRGFYVSIGQREYGGRCKLFLLFNCSQRFRNIAFCKTGVLLTLFDT